MLFILYKQRKHFKETDLASTQTQFCMKITFYGT